MRQVFAIERDGNATLASDTSDLLKVRVDVDGRHNAVAELSRVSEEISV